MRSSAAGRLATFGHYVTAFVIFMKAVDKAEQHWTGHEPMIVFFFGASVYVAVGTALHHRLHGWRGSLLQASFYALECTVLAWIASFLHEEGKRYLPFAFGSAAVLFLVAAVLATRRAVRERSPSPTP